MIGGRDMEQSGKQSEVGGIPTRTKYMSPNLEALGRKTTERIEEQSVLIVNLRGVGAE